MKRRNLFKLLAGAACAAAIELTGILPRVPKMHINPAWLKAQWESVVSIDGRVAKLSGIRYELDENNAWRHVPRLVGEPARWIPVPPKMAYLGLSSQSPPRIHTLEHLEMVTAVPGSISFGG